METIDQAAEAVESTCFPFLRDSLFPWGAMSSYLADAWQRGILYADVMRERGNQGRDLMHQLEGTENRINVARTRYNEAVKNFNYSIRSLPNSLTNSILLHLEKKEYFKADEAARKAPEVKFE